MCRNGAVLLGRHWLGGCQPFRQGRRLAIGAGRRHQMDRLGRIGQFDFELFGQSEDVQDQGIASGKLLWIKKYNSPNEGPDGVTVANGKVFGATASAAFALQAATGEQLWSQTLVRNANEGIDIALGADIDSVLGGVKQRSFFNNIVWPGQTDDVTVDTWMFDTLAQGLHLTRDQAAFMGRERAGGAVLGYMIAADATRDAAKRLGVSPDAVQAAYWLARQQEIGILAPGVQGAAGHGKPAGGVHAYTWSA